MMLLSATILLTLALHALAIPTPTAWELVPLAPKLACPSIVTTVFGVFGFDFPVLPSIPAGNKIWIQKSGTLDDDDDDDTSFAVHDELRLRQRAGGELNVRQAGPRPFENPNYRAIAAQQGVLMIHTVAGLLGNAAEMEGSLPARAWAGDHIFELNMLTQWLVKYNNAFLTQLISQCTDVNSKMTNILNSVTNLIGVDSVVNGLKMLVLQKNGPSNWAAYPAGVYLGLKNYLIRVGPHFNWVVQRIANELNDLHTRFPEDIPQSVGDSFSNWATGQWTNAVALINSHIGNTVGFFSDWITIDGPN